MSFLGDIFHGVTGAIGGLVSGGPLGAIGGAISGFTGGGGSQPAPTGVSFPSTPPISPTGYTVPVLARPSPVATPPRRTYGVDINPPFGGAPGAGINIGTGGSQFLLGIGQGLGQGAAQQAGQALQRSSSGGGLPMIGAIGVDPVIRQEAVSKCPTGYVLAKDGRCYPKKMVPKKWRKWQPRRHGPIRYRDWKAVKRANAARNRIVKVAREAGLKGGKKSW